MRSQNVLPTIGTSLVRLVLACVLPATLILVLLLAVDYQRERSRLRASAVTVASTALSLVERQIALVHTSLHALVTSPSLQSGDLRAFHEQASRVREGQPISSIFLTDLNGQQLVNTLRPFGEPLPHSTSGRALDRLRAGESLVISDLYKGGVTGSQLVSVMVPVYIQGKHAYNLGGAVFPAEFRKTLDAQQLPDGWIVSLVDPEGTIVARTHDMERFLGHKAAPTLVARMAAGVEGAYDGVTLDGQPIHAANKRLDPYGWVVAAGISTAMLMRDLTINAILVGSAVLALLGAGLLLARSLANRVSRSIIDLTAPAIALGEGREVQVPDVRVRESAEVAAALEKAADMLSQARYRASHDQLTGLANRGLFQELLDQQILLAQRERSPLSVLYLDLDGFKAVNDTVGHEAGDQLLQAVASRIREQLRASDIAARLSGDEFAVALIGSGAAAASAVAGKIAAALALPVSVAGRTVQVTASVGVVEHSGAANANDMLRGADRAMYRAKFGGKNRVETAGQP